MLRTLRKAAAPRKPRYTGKLTRGPKPTTFGEQTTGDHLVSRNKEVGEFTGDDDDAFFPGGAECSGDV